MVTFYDLKRAVEEFERDNRGDRRLDSSNSGLLLNGERNVRSVKVRWAIYRCDYISLDVETSNDPVMKD